MVLLPMQRAHQPESLQRLLLLLDRIVDGTQAAGSLQRSSSALNSLSSWQSEGLDRTAEALLQDVCGGTTLAAEVRIVCAYQTHRL